MTIKKHHFFLGGAFLVALSLLAVINIGKAAPLATVTEGTTSCNVYDEPVSSGITWAGNAVCTNTDGSAGCFMVCSKTSDAKITCASGYEPYDTGPLNDPSFGNGWACAKSGTAGTQSGTTYTFGTISTPATTPTTTPTITPSSPSSPSTTPFDYSKYFQQKTPASTAPSTKTETPSTAKPSTPSTTTPKTSTPATTKRATKPTTKPTSSSKTDLSVADSSKIDLSAKITDEEKPVKVAPLPKKEAPDPSGETIFERKAADTPAETLEWKDVTEKTKGHKEITKLTDYMVQLKNYRIPKNKLYKPKAKTALSFAVQIAVSVAGESCGTGIEKLSPAMQRQFGKKKYAPCVSKALELGLIDETAEIKKPIKRGDFYKLMLEAAKLPLVAADQKENVCRDVKPMDEFAAIVASAKRYGIAKQYKVKNEGGFCMPTGPLTKTDAAVMAIKTLEL